MVTHLPSNVMLVLVPLMHSEGSAIAMLCSRYTISQMDVGTRNGGGARVRALSGKWRYKYCTLHFGASVGPYLAAGTLYERPTTRDYPFFIAGDLKIMHDLLLLWAFSSVQAEGEHHLHPGGGIGVKMDERTPLQGITVKI